MSVIFASGQCGNEKGLSRSQRSQQSSFSSCCSVIAWEKGDRVLCCCVWRLRCFAEADFCLTQNWSRTGSCEKGFDVFQLCTPHPCVKRLLDPYDQLQVRRLNRIASRFCPNSRCITSKNEYFWTGLQVNPLKWRNCLFHSRMSLYRPRYATNSETETVKNWLWEVTFSWKPPFYPNTRGAPLFV